MVEFKKNLYYDIIVEEKYDLINAHTDFQVVLLDFGYAKDLKDGLPGSYLAGN